MYIDTTIFASLSITMHTNFSEGFFHWFLYVYIIMHNRRCLYKFWSSVQTRRSQRVSEVLIIPKQRSCFSTHQAELLKHKRSIHHWGGSVTPPKLSKGFERNHKRIDRLWNAYQRGCACLFLCNLKLNKTTMTIEM